MEITKAKENSHREWNKFIASHHPAVGGFLPTWEWGDFQKKLGRNIERYEVSESGVTRALFTLVHQKLPGNFSYGYLPRGPVLESDLDEEDIETILHTIISWAETEKKDFIFLRLEPSLDSFGGESRKFRKPSYYIQPRYNHTIELEGTLADIIGGFHPSTRSNIHRAENRGVTVDIKTKMEEEDWKQFFEMILDTAKRSNGFNAYPSRDYLRNLLASIPPLGVSKDPHELTQAVFFGYQDGAPAGAHVVVFFGGTATYLYGATYTNRLNSKVTTYLNWKAIEEAKSRGYRYYDLGAIDERRWPSITNYKRQFRGREFTYIGNIDIPLRPLYYEIYNVLKQVRH